MSDCLFCKIIKGEIPSNKVYEDDVCLAIRDINPQAPTHVLVMPKEHVISLAEAGDAGMLGNLLLACKQVAQGENLANGYRAVTNIGSDGCQSVGHLHIHVLGGEKLSETLG